MRRVALVAVNFVREQRWPILVLMLWVVLLSVLGLVVDLQAAREDVLLIFKQLAVYGVAFAVFFGASAIHNERKTRRVLAVLSKSVGRGEYISGLLLGIVLATGIYCFAMAVTGTWVLGGAGFPVIHLWALMIALMASCLLSATIAVLFSTFLNPLFATLATAFVLGVPAMAALQFKSAWAQLLPTYSLIEWLLKASFVAHWEVRWPLLLLAVAESAAFWLLAWRIFAHRDIAVAVD